MKVPSLPTDSARRGTIEAIAVVNLLTLAGAGALSLLTYTPLPLDCAIIFTSASLFGVAGWITVHTINALRKLYAKPPK